MNYKIIGDNKETINKKEIYIFRRVYFFTNIEKNKIETLIKGFFKSLHFETMDSSKL